MTQDITDRLAPVGSTGNNVHDSRSLPAHADQVAIEFKVTAIGATPTVTFAIEGSSDNQSVADAASDWYPLAMQPSGIGAAAETFAVTTVSVTTVFTTIGGRFAQKVRLVTTLNTNVTYEAAVISRDIH